MSKKNGSNGNAVATRPAFVIEMPDNSPALGFDPNLETFSWREVYPANYWNLDLLEERIELLGGNPVLTPARIVIKPVVDPELPEASQDKSPKLVLEFVENMPALVLNKTRCMIMSKLAGSHNPARWIEALGDARLELYPGAYREMADSLQVLIRPVVGEGQPAPNGNGQPVDVAAANEELFGD
jgi:hypothetical protein